MAVYFFHSLPNGVYSNLLKVPAFSSKSFSGKTTLSIKIDIYQHFPMIKPKSWQFVGLNCIELCFARLRYQLF